MVQIDYKRFIISILTIALIIFVFWLLLPSNYYVRQALLHLFPEIDQYPIFENRTVKTGDPQSWTYSADYNTLSVPEKYMDDFKKYGTTAFVIIQDGELLFEQYWDDYTAKTLSNSFSMSKSLVSLAVGCAIDDGFIRDVEQPVSDFFPQFGGYDGHKLTLKHLLTMSAGLDFQESYSSIFSTLTELYYGNNLEKITLNMKEIAKPGVKVDYQSGATQLIAFILEKATGESISSYVSRKLWTPLQAEEDALWSLDRENGMEKAFCCFNSTARDFARIGQLILNKGKWKGRQIVSPEYIQAAITPDRSLLFEDYNEPNDYYGYQFWTLRKNGYDVPYLRGILGQYVFAIPEKNAVVVRLGHKRSDQYSVSQHYPYDVDIWYDAAIDMINNTTKRARLVFGGDLMQHIPQITAARDGKGGYDFSESFRYVKPVFENADLAVINLETPLTTSDNFSGFPFFRAPEELAIALKDIGIDVAVMANNHVFDDGKRGVLTTQSKLNTEGIKYTGVFSNSEDFIEFHPLILKVNGFKLALLNYTYSTNGLPVPGGLAVNRIDSFAIARDIAHIDRSQIDAVIVFFHWGDEYSLRPNAEQKALAELCHRYGAEIVIGSHPHVVQPVVCSGDNGEINEITVFSLGNLVSNQRDRYCDGGIIVTLDVIKENGKKIKIKPFYIPVWVQLPKYSILPPNTADKMIVTPSDRAAYDRFVSDIKKIMESNSIH